MPNHTKNKQTTATLTPRTAAEVTANFCRAGFAAAMKRSWEQNADPPRPSLK